MTESAEQPKPSASAWLATRILRNRAIVRAPIKIYRAGFGCIFGERLLMLEHIGRKSGERRYVVLEVVGETEFGGYVVASGFGEQSQWFRNLTVEPRARIRIGRSGPFPVRARVLSGQEGAAALRGYAAKHPRAWKQLQPVFAETLGADISEDGTTLPMVALEPV